MLVGPTIHTAFVLPLIKVVETLTHLITSYNADNAISFLILRSALQSISNLSSESVGLDLCLICGVLREVCQLYCPDNPRRKCEAQHVAHRSRIVALREVHCPGLAVMKTFLDCNGLSPVPRNNQK